MDSKSDSYEDAWNERFNAGIAKSTKNYEGKSKEQLEQDFAKYLFHTSHYVVPGQNAMKLHGSQVLEDTAVLSGIVSNYKKLGSHDVAILKDMEEIVDNLSERVRDNQNGNLPETFDKYKNHYEKYEKNKGLTPLESIYELSEKVDSLKKNLEERISNLEKNPLSNPSLLANYKLNIGRLEQLQEEINIPGNDQFTKSINFSKNMSKIEAFDEYKKLSDKYSQFHLNYDITNLNSALLPDTKDPQWLTNPEAQPLILPPTLIATDDKEKAQAGKAALSNYKQMYMELANDLNSAWYLNNNEKALLKFHEKRVDDIGKALDTHYPKNQTNNVESEKERKDTTQQLRQQMQDVRDHAADNNKAEKTTVFNEESVKNNSGPK